MSTYRIGDFIGEVRKVPLSALEARITHDVYARLRVLENDPSFANLCKRMAATDGRANPIFVESRQTIVDGQKVDQCFILAGSNNFLAAKKMDMEKVFVIYVPSKDVQTFLSEYARYRPPVAPQKGEDEELLYRHFSED